jgi:PAS domain S-box-containing protein
MEENHIDILEDGHMDKQTYEELLEENKNYKDRNQHLELECIKLGRDEQLYRALFKHAGFSIVVLDGDTGEIISFNDKAYENLGYTEGEFRQLSIVDINKDGPSNGLERNLEDVKRAGSITFRAVHRTKNNKLTHELVSSVQVNVDDKLIHLDIWSNIDDLVKMEKELEGRVEERTKALQEKTENLKEMNSALNILLKKRETDKEQLQQNVMANIKELVNPYILLLKQGNLSERQKNHVEILESNLNDITSPFFKKLSDKLITLSPAEIKVANLIMQGRTSKEIALQLLLSRRTIDTHRNRIRKKIGLANTKISLQAYLLSL